ncbi:MULTISPECIES: hypothetical protein [unclassified Bacillus (in: firmicutes)]|uniref:hypothetical protein n=1 Tax=unclassified Bacillus (in: firmicutes) TaxID=185979 RepID=UPI0008E87FD1|nr:MULTISPECIES: hypothetical protein [unclassified Bacillus (in: firmicutes)]SFA75904.1 hypothetical protein SAMN02799634_101553 [Bacillus sp. UNCCL13]SFQ65914.1 hypothetical protein SAMN04488577_0828 [Bacillus sp. cl95]
MLKGMKALIIVMMSLLVSAGCQKDIPKPENKIQIVTVNSNQFGEEESIPVNNSPQQQDPFYVQSQINGKNVYIECIVRGVTFRNDPQSQGKAGKIIVTIDGKRNQEVRAAAFIIKGLSSGKHRIKLDIVKLNGEPYSLSKEFTISIK